MCTCIQQPTHDSPPIWEALFLLLNHVDQTNSTDERCGVLVYDAWRTRVQSRISYSTEQRGHAAVLILDIDRFKQINDSFGHLAGDRVIRNVADAIRSQVRAGDLVGRFGGDEFVVWLDHPAEPHAVHTIAERIRARVEDLCVTVSTPAGSQSVTGLSVSIGAAPHTVTTDATTTDIAQRQPELTALLWAADAALYRAKHAGRNRVDICHPSHPSHPDQRTDDLIDSGCGQDRHSRPQPAPDGDR